MNSLSKLPTGDSAPAIRLRKPSFCQVCGRITQIVVYYNGDLICVGCAHDAGVKITAELRQGPNV